jgi:lactoylglutathione lyase
MTESKKARAIGFNHVALEVGDIDEALEFYAKFIAFELLSKSENRAFIDLEDLLYLTSQAKQQSSLFIFR